MRGGVRQIQSVLKGTEIRSFAVVFEGADAGRHTPANSGADEDKQGFLDSRPSRAPARGASRGETGSGGSRNPLCGWRSPTGFSLSCPFMPPACGRRTDRDRENLLRKIPSRTDAQERWEARGPARTHGRHGREEKNEEGESVFQGPCIPCVPWTIVRTIPPAAPEGMSGPSFMPGPFFLLSTAAPTRSPV